MSFVCRVGFKIKQAFEAESNKGILAPRDWPVLEFCNTYGSELRYGSAIALASAGFVAAVGAIREWRVTGWWSSLPPLGCSLLSLLFAGLAFGEFHIPRGGFVGLGLCWGLWALSICSQQVRRERPEEFDSPDRLNPPYHWAPRILLSFILLAVCEVWLIAVCGTTKFETLEIAHSVGASVSVACLFGLPLTVGFLMGSWLLRTIWNLRHHFVVTVCFAAVCGLVWGGLLLGTAYQIFSHTLASFGMKRLAQELVAGSMCVIGSLSLWGHLADIPATSAVATHGAWRLPALILSPLRGLIRVLTGRVTLSSDRSITLVSLGLGGVALAVSVYLTYWEFMDYSRCLHRTTATIMVISWIASILIGLEWTLNRSGRVESSNRIGIPVSITLLIGVIGVSGLAFPGTRIQGNVEFLLVDKTELNRQMIAFLRDRWDRDRDGDSAWLGGDDPDDQDRTVTALSQMTTPAGRATEALPVEASHSVRRTPLLVVVTIETFRSDCSAIYSPDRTSITPQIDEFARGSTVFMESYATSNSTVPTQASLLTGRYPSRYLKKRRELLLLDMLGSAGYQTLLTEKVYHDLFINNLGTTPPQFPEYKCLDGWYANETLPALVAELDRLGGSPAGICAVFHLNGAHFPYKPSRGIPEADDRDRYQQCLGEVDEAWGEFVRDLKTRGWYDDACLVVTGDHGEEFWEHGHKYHGMYLYEESVRTPLMIKGPQSVPGRYRGGVSTIDVLPTIAELISVRLPNQVDGRSLAFALRGEPAPASDRRIFLISSHSDTYGVVDSGRWKLTFDRRMSVFELYDLQNDPGEVKNLIDQEALKFQELRGIVGDFIEAGQGRYTDPDPFEEEK